MIIINLKRIWTGELRLTTESSILSIDLGSTAISPPLRSHSALSPRVFCEAVEPKSPSPQTLIYLIGYTWEIKLSVPTRLSRNHCVGVAQNRLYRP